MLLSPEQIFALFKHLLVYIQFRDTYNQNNNLDSPTNCYGGHPLWFVYSAHLLATLQVTKDHGEALNELFEQMQNSNSPDILSDIAVIEDFLNKLDLSQRCLLSQYTHYLAQSNQLTFQHPVLAEIRKGECGGLSINFLLSIWLYIKELTTPADQITNSPNLVWFLSSIINVVNWDKQLASLTQENIDQFDTFFGLTDFHQDPHSYSVSAGQGDLDRLINQAKTRKYNNNLVINGLIKHVDIGQHYLFKVDKTPLCDYSLAGLFTENDLNKSYSFVHEKTKQDVPFWDILLKIDNLVLVRSHNHSIALVRLDDCIIFYDANHQLGPIVFEQTQLQNISRCLFDAFKYTSSIPSPIGFRVFNLEKNNHFYPPQSTLLTPSTNYYVGNVTNDANKTTALHIAAVINCKESFKHYLETSPAHINTLDENGITCFFIAICEDFVDILQLAIDAQADLNFTSKGYSLLAAAIFHNQPTVAKLLLAIKANIEQTVQDSNHSVLHIAAYRGYAHFIQTLLDAGLNINAVTTDGHSALHLAALHNHKEVVELLLKNSANHELLDNNGKIAQDLTSDREIYSLISLHALSCALIFDEDEIDDEPTKTLFSLTQSPLAFSPLNFFANETPCIANDAEIAEKPACKRRKLV